MRFTMARDDLAKALAAVAPAIPSRPYTPALAAVRLELTDGTLHVAASSGDLTIRTTALTGKGSDGLAHVSGHVLRDLVGKFTGADVTFERVEDTVTLKCGRSEYRLRVVPDDEYPALPVQPPKVGGVPAEGLNAAVAAVSHAATDSPDVASVQGLLIETDGDTMWLIGTDRFRLAAASLPWEGDDWWIAVTREGLQAAARNLFGHVSVCVDDNLVTFADQWSSVTIRKLYRKEAVKWRGFVEVQPPATHFLNRAELIAAIQRLLIVVEKAESIRVTLGPEEAALSTLRPEDADEPMECVGTEPAAFLISPAYLVDALNAITTDEVQIGTVRESRMKGTTVRPFAGGEVAGDFSELIVNRRDTTEGRP